MNIFTALSRFFYTNSAVTWLLMVGIFLGGIGGFLAMPQQYNPEVTLPAFMVETQFPGATAHEVESLITQELEEKISEIAGVDTLSSVSVEGGISQIQVQFHVGEEMEDAKVQLYSKIQEHLDMREHENIAQPIIKTITPDNVSVGVWALTSRSLSQNGIREKGLQIADKLRSIDGVANIEVTGGEKRAITIMVDPEKLRERNISLVDVSNALKYNNGRAFLGDIKQSSSMESVRIDTFIESSADAKQIVVSSGVTMGDIAVIQDGYEYKTSFTTLSHRENLYDQDAVYISLAKRKGENTADIMNEAFSLLESIETESEYNTVQVQNIVDTSRVAAQAIEGLGLNLIQSIAIVSLLLFFFLGGRASFLVALTIPLTLFFVFFVGYLFGQTINKITLFALILSLGLLVDSAMVVVENIHRHIHIPDERSKQQKVLDAVGEVGMGLFVSTLTSVLVFLPLTQISGMMGPYMGPLAFFVPAALICSLFVAYTITPFLSGKLFSAKEKISAETSIVLEGGKHSIPTANVQKKEGLFTKIQKAYGKLLSFVLQRKSLQGWILMVVFGLLLCSFLLIPFQGVHFQMLPKGDNKNLWITVDMQEGTTSTKSQRVALEIVDEVSEIEDIESVIVFTALSPLVDFNGLFRGFSYRSAEHQSSLFVSLKDERQYTSSEIAKDIRAKISHLSTDENADIQVVEDPPGPPVLSTLHIKVLGDERDDLTAIQQWVEKKLYTTDGVVDIVSSAQHLYPQTTFVVDHAKAKENNISAYQVFESLQLSVQPIVIGTFSYPESLEQSVIEFSIVPDQRGTVRDMSDIWVENNAGIMIRLSEVVQEKKGVSSTALYRDDHVAFVDVRAEMEERSIVYATIDIAKEIWKDFEVESFSLYGIDIQEKETGARARIEWGGEMKMTLDNFRDLSIAMLVALSLVYIVLVAQFSSFMVPLLIMATVPLALLGILPGFALLDLLNDTFLTATALIGFIALMGIVVNNAIIYLEYVQVLRVGGMDTREAIVKAGETRLRPILLTSLTTVLGSLTIAGDSVWSGLAWSIVFGLSLSCILTLGVFPIVYWRHLSSRSQQS